MKVVIILKHHFSLWTSPDWFVEKLRAEFPDVVFHLHNSYDGIEEDLKEADAVLTWSLRADQVKAAPRLRWIHSTAAGVHQLMIPEIVNSNITVTNARSVHGPVVAEHVLALIFALAKRVPTAVRMQQKHHWGQDDLRRDKPALRELRDSTLGLIGTGSIGGHVAKIAVEIGMRVIAIRANPQKGVDWLDPKDPRRSDQRVYPPKDINRLLNDSDFVVICAPVTNATEHLIDGDALAAMKSDAYLINVARGALVDQKQLIDVLQKKKIAGAALDVFEEEPLPETSPLWDMENVLITPHQAGIAEKLWERQYKLFSENLRRYLGGAPLLGLVNKQAGY
jgi:D-2-hydroxyacid dehydrogenase (NADP+)